MKQPFYTAIIFQIERTIAEADRLARSREVMLTDSQIISVLTKVAGAASGRQAKTNEASSPREQMLSQLREQLAAVRESLAVRDLEAGSETPLAAADWIAALQCVTASARLRKGTTPGSRGYLDFLDTFIAQAGRG